MTVDDGYGAGGRGTRVILWVGLGAVLVAVLAVVGLHAWGAFRLAALEEAVRDAAGPAPPAPATIPEDENAAARILSGAELLTPEHHLAMARLRLRPVARWSADDYESARETLLTHAGALARMRGAADLPGSSFVGVLGDWESAPEPELLPLVTWGGELLRLHVWVALAQGEPDLAADSIRTLARLAEGLYAVPSMAAVVAGAEAERDALLGLQALVAAGAAPDLVERIAEALPESDPRQAYRRGVAGLLDAVRAGEADPARVGSRGGVASYALRDQRLADALEGSAITAAAPDDRPLSAVRDELEAAAGDQPRDRPEDGAGDRPEASFESQALTVTRTALAGRQLAHLAVALRRQAAASGAYPRTAPAAPADPVEGGPFAYQLRSDGSVRLAYPTAWQAVESPEGGHELLDWTLPAPRAPARQPEGDVSEIAEGES